MVVQQILNVQPESDTAYIAGIQQKSIPFEHRFILNIESNLKQLRDDVEYYKATQSLENNVVLSGSYESIDARGKGWKKENLKRKISRNNQYEAKKQYSPLADSAAGRESEMKIEYCNAVSNDIVVRSRDSELTLRPRSTPHPTNGTSYDEANISSIPDNSVANVISKGTTLTDSTAEGGGDGDESDEDNKEKVTSTVDTRPRTVFEENYKKILDFKRKFQEEWKTDKRKYIVEHLEHAYNECLKNSNIDVCTLTKCSGPQAKAFCDDLIQKVLEVKSVEDSQMSTLVALLYHSMMCSNKSNCSMPLCADFMKSIRKWFEEQLDDASENDYVSLAFTNEQPELLYSNTEAVVDNNGKITSSHFQINHSKFLGKGGFGSVYDCWVAANKSDARMAIKKMALSAELPKIDDMVANLRCVRNGPNLLLPDLIISTKSRKLAYFVMERGEISLSHYLRKVYKVHETSCHEKEHIGPCNSGLPVETCCKYFLQLARAVDYIHDHDFVHGDIKCDNVMIMPGYNQVNLIDFDTLKKESVRAVSGTHGYAAPEVYYNRGNVTKASDVYSLCSTIPELYYVFAMQTNKRKEIAERNLAIYRWMKKKEKSLALIFHRGTQIEPNKRPTIKQLVRCFEQNLEMHEMVNANVDVPPLHDIYVERANEKDRSPANNSLDPRAAVCKQVLEKWLEHIMGKLPSRFPTKWPVESSYDERFDSVSPGSYETGIDLSLEDILNNRDE